MKNLGKIYSLKYRNIANSLQAGALKNAKDIATVRKEDSAL